MNALFTSILTNFKSHFLKIDKFTKKNMKIPNINKDQFEEWNEEIIFAAEEWIAKIFLDIPVVEENAFPTEKVNSVSYLRAEGLLSAETLLKLIMLAKQSSVSKPTSAWISVSILAEDGIFIRGGKCLKTVDKVLTIFLSSDGDWVARKSQQVDFSGCKPSKYA